MRILGIDPGSTAMGWGVVDVEGKTPAHVAHGVLRPPRAAALSTRLAFLYAELGEVIAAHAPETAVVEKVFVATNPHSALVLGQARGCALAALGAANLEVAEVAAREIKQAVVGSGAAEKRQVQAMVARLLHLDAPPPSDAADALAAALCIAHQGPLAQLGVAVGARRRSRRQSGWRRNA